MLRPGCPGTGGVPYSGPGEFRPQARRLYRIWSRTSKGCAVTGRFGVKRRVAAPTRGAGSDKAALT